MPTFLFNESAVERFSPIIIMRTFFLPTKHTEKWLLDHSGQSKVLCGLDQEHFLVSSGNIRVKDFPKQQNYSSKEFANR